MEKCCVACIVLGLAQREPGHALSHCSTIANSDVHFLCTYLFFFFITIVFLFLFFFITIVFLLTFTRTLYTNFPFTGQ